VTYPSSLSSLLFIGAREERDGGGCSAECVPLNGRWKRSTRRLAARSMVWIAPFKVRHARGGLAEAFGE
jgi:hypothetical protein